MTTVDYFFSGKEYIRVRRDDTGPGSPDKSYPKSIQNWDWPDGFGVNGIDAALYSGSKCYFFKGAHYLRVTRNDTVGPSQQDFRSPQPISDWGWPKGFGENGIDAALWSGPVCYFFKGTEYIRVTRGDSDFGSVDNGYPQPLSNWNFPKGFGTNGIKAALYSGSVCYFFDGPYYVRVHRGLEGAGYIPKIYPRFIKDVWGWPDGFGDNGIDAALYSGGPLVPQPTPITGNNNYYLQDGGNPLLGVRVTVSFDENFVSTAKGFSFQLNAVSAGSLTGTATFQQFVIWNPALGTVTSAFADIWLEKNGQELLRTNEQAVVTLTTATTIPQGYRFNFALVYDGDIVTGCSFTVTDVDGNTVGTPQTINIGGQTWNAPITSFSFNIGGEAEGATGTIAPGAAGTITYSSSNPLTAETGDPSDLQTVENCNVIFGPLPNVPHPTVTQGFVAVPSPNPGPGDAA